MECPEELRPALLERTCGADSELRTEVASLLACLGKGEGLLAGTIGREAKELAETQAETLVDQRIGPYRIVKLLGRGGMGAVYLARRDDDAFHKQVALKVIKRGMDTDEIILRFRNERGILARLEHPNIARLLDGGTTADGVPYFVMEYVEGQPLTEYCVAHNLSVEERLKLFRPVCAAVHYAHQNLVVHRDLKPHNILVAAGAVGPRVKLLDFGIAKMLNEDGSHTRTTTLALTPDYSSPEQAVGGAITTATDVYSLGVILYELLAGRRPHDLAGQRPAAITQAICETDPPPPSRYDRRLRGDLDGIVMTAIRKEPSTRYSTAEQLSEDVRRYLAGLPVAARPDTIFYRAGKLVRRNKLATAAILFAWVALAAGFGAAAWQAWRAERGSREARQYASDVLMNSFRRLRMVPGALRAEKALVDRSLAYLNQLAAERSGDPQVRLDLAVGYFQVAQIQGSLGRMNLGRYEESEENTRKVLAIAEDLYRRDPSKQEHIALLASAYHQIGLCEGALGYHREAYGWYVLARPLVAAAEPGAFDKVGYSPLRPLNERAIALTLAAMGRYREALDIVRPLRSNAASGTVAVALSHAGRGDIESARGTARLLVPAFKGLPSGVIHKYRYSVKASLSNGTGEGDC